MIQRFALFLMLLATPFAAAWSQALEINIIGGNPSALPIAVVPFVYTGVNATPATDVAAVVRADLERSGKFRGLADADIIEKPARGEEVNFATWRLLRQDFLLVGRVLDSGSGAYRVEYELFDVAKQERLLGMALNGEATTLRDVAHQIADQIYEKVTGVRGAFWTRMAYITANGLGNNINYALMIADADGQNPVTVVRSKEPLLSPAWSPDGKYLAYVSFERGNSSIYLQELASGQRELLAAFKGINGAPAFSPDGKQLALTLSKGGSPDIYVMDIASRALRQLTSHWAIDTEPAFSADGQAVYFTSDRSGKPQIYKVPAAGGEASRVTFEGEYNARVTLCCDGKMLAMAQGNGNVYRIALLDRSLGGSAIWRNLSPGSLDESPSFAPNGSMLLYAAREGMRGVLYVVSADARVRQRLVLADGDVREPAWSPYRAR